jgi:hypothetical protein
MSEDFDAGIALEDVCGGAEGVFGEGARGVGDDEDVGGVVVV